MIVDAYNNVPDVNLNENVTYGKDTLNVAAMNVGYGDRSFKSDDQGIWLGANFFKDAPFKVTMDGALTAISATITGYASDSDLTDLENAALVKASTTQILSGKIIVGDNKIVIDGVNKRIIINDGTNDRVLLGYQAGGF